MKSRGFLLEHLHHFNLTHDPFQNEPDLRFYFASAYHRDVQLRLERGLRQHKGLSVLTGEGGTGKTLLARRILDSLEEEIFDANLMMMLAGAADAESVLSRFARQVGVETPSDDRSTLLAQMYEQLAIVREDGRHCVLILDDAHILKRDAMAEISGLLNLEYEDRRLLSLLLVGLPELDVTISHETSFAQRVDVRVHLQPLDLQNTGAYVLHRLCLVGGRPGIFPEGAIEALHKFSRGRPRLLNTLADNSLFEAYLDGESNVAARHVERAAGDLGIGLDPGSTYQSVAVTREPSPAPAMQPLAVADASPMAAQLAPDLEAAPEFGAVSEADVPAPGDSGELDIAALLDDSADPDGDLHVLNVEAPVSADDGGMRDLDAELVLDDSSPELRAFSAENASAPGAAEATRVSFGDDTISGVMPADESEPAEPENELDDLFVELIEE